MPEMLDSEEAARRLGVKLATLYAYVSRGVLQSHPGPDAKRRLFAREDVERLAARSRQGKAVETRLATVTTSITHLGDDGPRYRGRPLGALVEGSTYEDVVALLWGVEPGPFEAAPVGRAPKGMSDPDRLRWAVITAAAHDPFRLDLRPDAFTAAARTVMATATDALPVRSARPAPALRLRSSGRRHPGSLAGQLCDRLAGSAATAGAVVEAVNAALVTMADHELATATLAARVAASTRTDVYGTLLAALGTMGGRLHGAASNDARALLAAAHRHGAAVALGEALAGGRAVPGFCHTVYVADPRTGALLDRARSLATDAQRRTLDEVLAIAEEREVPAPNVDLGLAALTWAASLVPDAGETIATVARMAGWVAHALEEHQERPLRFRARAVYATRPSDVP